MTVTLKSMEIHFKIGEIVVSDLTESQKKALEREANQLEMRFDEFKAKFDQFTSVLEHIRAF